MSLIDVRCVCVMGKTNAAHNVWGDTSLTLSFVAQKHVDQPFIIACWIFAIT